MRSDGGLWKIRSCSALLFWNHWAWSEYLHLVWPGWLQTQAVHSSTLFPQPLFVFSCHHEVYFHISSIVNHFSITASPLERVFPSRLPITKFSLMGCNISNLEFYLNVNIGSERSVNYTEQFKLLFKMATQGFITKIIYVLCILNKLFKTYIKTVWLYIYTYNLFE